MQKMQQEEDNRKFEFASCNITPKKLQRTPRDAGSERKDILSEVKRRIHSTPQNSPNRHPKTPQSSGSFRKDVKLHLECTKRKIPSPHKESLEKIQKTSPSGKFVNTLIGQWYKLTGVRTALPQTVTQENSITEEMRRMYGIEERKIQKLQKKLQSAEETISSLSASHEAELRAKEDILQQLNSDWESITNYYDEISESLKGFQQHKDNLSKLYNDVIITQQSTVKKLQQELSTMKLKDDAQRNIVSTIENKLKDQEKRIHGMMIAETELKKQFEDMKDKSTSEKNYLHNVHAEEKLELMKKQENLTSMNQELQVQLQKITEEKQDLSTALAEKDDKIVKLQEEISTYKNKIGDLLYRNTELSSKYETSFGKEEELSKQLQWRTEEVEKLQENLNTRQELESSLAQDLEIIDNKYRNVQNDFINVENKLKETQVRNLNLEQSFDIMKRDNEHKIVELNRKIEFLEREKERMILEKHSKIQELEHAYNLLKEKHEAEITSLKQKYDVKLTEMTKTVTTQHCAFLKLNETLNKMNKDNQNRQTNSDQCTIANRNKLQENLGTRMQPLVESNDNVIETRIKEIESQTQTSQVREMKEQQFQDQENVDRSKAISKDKNEMSDLEQDIYNFSDIEVNNESQTVLSQNRKLRFQLNSPTKIVEYTENYPNFSQNKNITQSNIKIKKQQEKKNEDKNNSIVKKRIFKTRGTGLRQYGTTKNLQYGTLGKISKK
ncbi:synaptonemal complex protein 1-like [Bombus vosnesenskii]|uniref:Synaptonemal complex protein 1-like n=1 Tax=Bombus vosnesenskii TaxID=207650 RepID=A0A6J3L6K0_9HYME|nr:synaptonemal complex protein 1-like [Bombus vosnesenskii]